MGFEYMLILDGEPVYDPLNHHRTSNGFGKHNHYFYMPGKRPAREARRNKSNLSGRLLKFRIDTEDYLGDGPRGVTIYSPPVDEPARLMVVFDGQDYLERASLNIICDNLIARQRICPLGLAFVENGKDRRTLEYACAEGTLGFLLEKVLPLAREELNLVDPSKEPGAWGVVGASMGGLMALYTGLRLPGIFGHVLAQSGAYTLHDHRFPVWDLVRLQNEPKPRVWMDAGSMERLLGCNQEMAAHLRNFHYDAVYQEYQGGHNFIVWRDDLPSGMEWLWNWK
jgi:enterochelin esterase-like enzyme